MLSGCRPGVSPTVPNEGALSFDGRGGRVSLGVIGPGHPLLLTGSTFTISVRFRQEADGDLYQRIIDKSDERVGRNGWALGADPESGQVHFYVHDGKRGADYCSSRGSYDHGRWHHVVAVARSDRYELWIDGRRDTSAFFEEGAFVLPGAGAAPASLGNWNHRSDRSWHGSLDEIAVWSRDLGEAEIAEIHDSGGSLDLLAEGRRYRSSSRLVAWWRMEPPAADQPSGIVTDSSRSGLDGVLEAGEGGTLPVITPIGTP